MPKRIKGLTDREVLESREKYGANALVKQKSKGVARRFFENLSDPIIKILIAALALEVIFTFGNCNLFEVFGIILAILIATVVSTLSEYGSERAFEKIEEESKGGVARVLRSGSVCEIPAEELVVGDVVYLSEGEKIHADGEMLEGELNVDQSALNGENVDARKRCRSGGGFELSNEGKVFRGSVISGGEGIMRVLRVGESSYYGMVAKDVQSETRESPLKLRLSRLAKQISTLGYIVAFLVGFIYLFNVFVVQNGFDSGRILASLSDTRFLFSSLIHALTLMITVVVVAVPEGLPMMITVVLSANMKRMIRDKILVKKMVGIETAGSLNILFTDKTGTLTSGRLGVGRIISYDGIYKTQADREKNPSVFESLCTAAHYNTEAKLTSDGVVGGNSTDKALLDFFSDRAPREYKVIDRIPFSSDIKYSSVTLEGGRKLIKGAPEIILSKCRYALRPTGERIPTGLDFVREEYSLAAKRGERVIAVAEAMAEGNDLTFVALLVLKDSLRPGVKEAVENIQSAGIQIVMVTGDNKDTAVSIAEECGFYKSRAGHIALDGEEMRGMTDEELKAALPKLRVVARALPRDKSRLVELSQSLNLVVGMTGDGVNDAPSLKLADVGFAMGSGTDIAKGAGDIVILDNSIGAISKTILYGRTIFKSIRKFITFQLIMNFAACGITLIGPFISVDTPITIIQMLWVNIIMDTLGGLAFAGEPPLECYMREKPKRRDEPLISRKTVWQIVSSGIYTLGLLILFLSADFFRGYYGSENKLLTAFYALFIFAGLFNCLAARSERLFFLSGIGKNKLFVFIMLFISAIQLLIVYFGGSLFRSSPLSASELALAVGVGLTVLLFDGVRRIAEKLSR